MEQATSQGSIRLENGLAFIRVPVHFKRRSGRKALVVPPEGGSCPPSGGPDDPLALALARAHVWLGWLETGKFRSISALARARGVGEAYVRRLLHLTSLAPDIVAAILEGGEPGELSVRQLLKAPLCWDEQRQHLGFKKVTGVTSDGLRIDPSNS